MQFYLRQKQCNNGPLCSGEGVYHAAKEIHLCHPEKFSNAFIVIGGFHLEQNSHRLLRGISRVTWDSKAHD